MFDVCLQSLPLNNIKNRSEECNNKNSFVNNIPQKKIFFTVKIFIIISVFSIVRDQEILWCEWTNRWMYLYMKKNIYIYSFYI